MSIVGTSILIWGRSTYYLFFLQLKGFKQLSFFNFSRKIIGLILDQYSLYLMGLVLILALFFIYKKKIDLLPAVLLTLSLGFSFYKVGHTQFYLIFFALSPMTIRYIYDKKLISHRKLLLSYLLWICYLNFFQTFYYVSINMQKGFSLYSRLSTSTICFSIIFMMMSNKL